LQRVVQVSTERASSQDTGHAQALAEARCVSASSTATRASFFEGSGFFTFNALEHPSEVFIPAQGLAMRQIRGRYVGNALI